MLAKARSVVLAPVASQASAVEVTCKKVDMTYNHEGPDLEHQVQRNVRSFGALVVHAEAHDAESGVSIMRLSSKSGWSHEVLKCPACVRPVPIREARVRLDVLLKIVLVPQDCTVL